MAQEKWYTRPIFSVSNMQDALTFYCNKLGFEQSWKHDEDGQTTVTQVNMGDLEIILTSNLDRLGQGRLYIALETDEMKSLQKAIEDNNIEFDRIQWGYPLLRIRDSDGNEMLFSSDTVC